MTMPMKTWIDEEYGFELKSITPNIMFEVTEFKVGGCKMTDLIDLSEYSIVE
ncbi:MAG: hypothetical protein FWG14_05995 [Peptococcaceae bacterium]|nr:hypothetical protein [Peptococcaceae bacterium]